MLAQFQIPVAGALLIFAAVGSGHAQSDESAIAPSHRIELFDGKTLSGWTFVSKNADENARAIWSATNGVIECAGKPNGYARTRQRYKDYHLHAEWRWPDGPGNSGIFLHLNGGDKVWPLCLEAQLQSGNAGEVRFNGGARLSGKPPTFKSLPRRAESSEKPVGEWNNCDIVCRSNIVSVRVNGVLQNEVSGASVSSGAIGLQAEGRPVQFRNIWIEPAENP